MLASVALLLAAWASGVGLTLLTGLTWDLEGRLATGFAIGCGALAMVGWLAAIPAGMSTATVWAAAIAVLAIGGVSWLRGAARDRLRSELLAASRRWRSPEAIPIAFVLIAAATYFGWFFSHAVVINGRGLFAAYESVYWDWPHHLGLTAYLSATRHLLPPSNPWYVGISLNYSFLPDLLAAMMSKTGIDLVGSLELTSALLAISVVVSLFSLILHLTGSRWVAIIAVVLVMLSGGFGFADFLRDARVVGGGSLFRGVDALLASPQGDYTFDKINYWWYNPVVAYLIPQRNVLLGWPLGFVALRLLWEWWRGAGWRLLGGAGLVLGLLPPFHLNSYVALLLFSGGLFLMTLSRWRDWLMFAVPAFFLGGLLAYPLIPPASVRSNFVRLQFEWTATSAGHPQNVLLFWLLQTILFIPLAVAAVLRPRWWPAKLRGFLLPAWGLFIFANFVVLQPSDWDNSKLLIWWAMLVAVPAAIALLRLASISGRAMTIAVLILVVQSLSGLIDLHRTLLPVDTSTTNLKLTDSDGVQVAAWVRDSTKPDSVLLTSWSQNDPVRLLGGRVQLLAGDVSMKGLGVNIRPRMDDVRTMLGGQSGADGLLRRLGVTYVVEDPSLDLGLFNRQFYDLRYPVVYRSPHGEYKVFRVG